MSWFKIHRKIETIEAYQFSLVSYTYLNKMRTDEMNKYFSLQFFLRHCYEGRSYKLFRFEHDSSIGRTTRFQASISLQRSSNPYEMKKEDIK